MNNEVKQRNKVAKRAEVNVYLSGGNGRVYWPYRLQPYDESTPSVRRKAFSYILDSGFARDDEEKEEEPDVQLTDFSQSSESESPETSDKESTSDAPSESIHNAEINRKLIKLTYERRPEYIIPNDSIHPTQAFDPSTDGYRTAIEDTAEIVDHFLGQINEREFPATVIIPLQPPHALHYFYLRENYPEQVRRGHFALGGMKNFTPSDQLSCVREFRRVAGYDAYVHGFGMGASRQVILALRDNPNLLDSVDFSTPQQHANNAKFAGPSRKPVHVGRSMGEDSSTTSGSLLAAELTDICRMLSPTLTDDADIDPSWDKLPFDDPGVDPDTESEVPATQTEADQSGLSSF